MQPLCPLKIMVLPAYPYSRQARIFPEFSSRLVSDLFLDSRLAMTDMLESQMEFALCGHSWSQKKIARRLVPF